MSKFAVQIILGLVLGLGVIGGFYKISFNRGVSHCEAEALKSSNKADARADNTQDQLDDVADNTQPILDQGRDNQDQVISKIRGENYLLRVEIDRLKREAQNADTSYWDSGDLPDSVRDKWTGINQQIFGPGTVAVPDRDSLAGGDGGSKARDAAQPDK